jgi:hypothetical protein
MIDARHGALALALLLGGCATTASQTTLSNVTDKFSQVVSSSSSLLKTEIDNKPKVRRGEALELFLRDPHNKINFTADQDTAAAFAVYVCAGSNALHKEKSFLNFANAYATAAQGIVKPGGNSFAEQWKKYLDLRKPVELPKEGAAADTDAFKQCNTETAALLTFKGTTAFDQSDEAAFLLGLPAALEAYKTLLDALQNAAKDGLAVANQIEARKKFMAYVNAMHPKFVAALDTELPQQRLQDSWKRRKGYALWAPYQTFVRIVAIRKKQTGELDAAQMFEIKELALKLQGEMAEYDALRTATPPDKMAEGLMAAEAKVYEAANDEHISLDTVLDFLTDLVNFLQTAEKDYNAIQSAAERAAAATSAIGK